MNNTALTQDLIDGTACEERIERRGLAARVAKHPLIIIGLLLTGVGLAYALGRKPTSEKDAGAVEWATEENDQGLSGQQSDEMRGATAVTGNVEAGAQGQIRAA